MLTDPKERRPPLDTPAAAAYLNVLPSYLERLRCNGDGPVFIKRNGLVRYDPDDLDAWLEAGKRQSTSDESDAEYALVSGDQILTRWVGAKPDLADSGYRPAGYTPIDGDRWIPIENSDTELFDSKIHWRLKPHIVIEADRVRRVYPVVLKSWRHA